MKKISLYLFIFFSFFVKAQLDTDHWFAPMATRAFTSGLQSYLYLSTNEVTPFSVQVFNNNSVFATVQLSKGNPVKVDIPEDFMMTNQSVFVVNSMGLYVKGAKKFFANYRFSVTNHAEIITSKGLAGLGTTFYAAMAPVTGPQFFVNSTIGVTATEDNTQVTLSGYDPGVIFSDGTSSPTKTFTLNRGQSYVIDAISTDAQSNLAGLVGAKIEANHPISVTNGNANGIYTNLNFSNNDILMDQAVPVDRLGKDFVVVKGNGTIASEMETVLIIATENNTPININGAFSGITLNEGEYYLVPSTQYIDQGNGHYNVGISSTKNIYVYQLLAGVGTGLIHATGGFNYIPPLSCFLPNTIDEIGFVNEIGNTQYNTKLNIITQSGAAVTLNGNPLPATSGPFSVTGNPNWVTYSVPNVSGNITLTSNKSITAGITGGSGAVGYGGYFAGFSSVPVISKTGDCFNGIILQVDNTYDGYQWYFNGTAISGATTFFINPEQFGAGLYTCLITKNNCDTKLTLPYDYDLCPPISTTTFSIGSCKNQIINPAFTTSSQTIVPTSTAIIVQPTVGNVAINSTNGQITYTPNAGLLADTQDEFVYYIQGSGSPFDFEYFRVKINIDVLQTNNAALSACSTQNNMAVFDLTTASVSTDANTTVAYFSSPNLANPILNPTQYTGAAGTVFANVTSEYGCTQVAQIALSIIESPNINTANFNSVLCDDNLDGVVPVVFSAISPQIVNNSANFVVKYYLNQADANAGNANTLPNNWSYTTTTTVYVRVESTSANCPPAFGQIIFSKGNPLVLLADNVSATLCDDDLNGSESVNLSNYNAQFSIDPTAVFTFYTTLANAQSGVNAINSIQNINASSTTYFVRITSTNACPTTATLNILLKKGKKSDLLVDKTICKGDMALLDAGPGFDAYLWSNGATTPSILVGEGDYFVDLTSNGCVYRQNVKVTTKEVLVLLNIVVTNSDATINVTGGQPPYLYSLNGIDYQTSNVFLGLPRGTYTVYVKDANDCFPVTKEFLMINLINAITPNGDGYNDYLDYSELRLKKEVSIQVFDRYGYSVFSSQDKNYRWNGTKEGNPLPTGTYWYVIKWKEPDTSLPIMYSGWLLIKNRN